MLFSSMCANNMSNLNEDDLSPFTLCVAIEAVQNDSEEP